MIAPPTGWCGRYAQLYVTALGELERVRQEILQNLIQPLRIGVDRGRQRLIDLNVESEPLVFGHMSKGSFQVLLHFLKVNLSDVHRDSARFDLGKVENIIDQFQKVDP